MEKTMRLADSHIHLFKGGYSERYGAAAAHPDEVALYEELRRAHDIDCSLVVGYEGEARFQGNNTDLAAWARDYSWIQPLWYHAIDAPPLVDDLRAAHEKGFVGISLYATSEQAATHLDGWDVTILEWLNSHQHIISINTNPDNLSAIKPFLERLQNCHVLISHLGSPGAHPTPPTVTEVQQRLEPLRRASELPHVNVKLSGLYAISDPSHDYPHEAAWPFLQQVRTDYGAQRLFWGSDFSPALEHISFSQTIDALNKMGWRREEMEAIMGGNLRRILDKPYIR
jgi:L-fuconolactonase